MKYLLAVAALSVVVLAVGWTRPLTCESVGTCPPPNTNQLVTNGSFEVMTLDAHIPDGWIGDGLTGSEGQDCTTAQEGQCSFLMQAHGANRVKTLTQIINHQGLATEVGTLSFVVKSEGVDQGFPAIAAIYHHADGSTETFTAPGEGGFHSWQGYDVSYTVSQDYTSIEVVLTFGGAEKVWFDSARLTYFPAPPPSVTLVP